MSIREQSKRANSESLKEEHPERYVVPESAIRDFIGSLSIHAVSSAVAGLQIVADITSDASENRIDRLRESDLQLLNQIASESSNRHYQRVMRAIIVGVGQGPHGINAAHLTANRAVELAFRWTHDYISALKQYRDKLRSMR